MKEIILEIRELIERAVKGILPDEEVKPGDIVVMPTDRPEFGDYYTNIALRLAGKERSAFDVASVIKKSIEACDTGILKKIEVKNGFLNFFIDENIYLCMIRDIAERKDEALKPDSDGSKKRFLIEFVSANPTGPLTIAHGRQAAFGEALSRILKFKGFNVTREYYINDGGRQISLLGESLKARYLNLKSPESAVIPEEGYRGDYLVDIAEKITGEPSLEDPDFFASFASGAILGQIKDDLKDFGVCFDSLVRESSFLESGKVEAVLEMLKEKDLLYFKDGSWWFKSSEYGDEKDRVVIKKDGSYTYLAGDIAYHKDKIERGFTTLVNIIGPDHHGYIDRMKAAVSSLNFQPENLNFIIVQLTTLYRGKEKLSMSTRKGEFISLRQLIDEVGPDASKFFLIFRRPDSHLDFDLELAKKKSMENPVYYLQYAYVRLKHILKFAGEKGLETESLDPDLSLLVEPEEIAAAKKVSEFIPVIDGISDNYGVHLLTDYLYSLAKTFNSYYQKHQVVGEDLNLTHARLTLIKALYAVFSTSLGLLNISLPEEM